MYPLSFLVSALAVFVAAGPVPSHPGVALVTFANNPRLRTRSGIPFADFDAIGRERDRILRKYTRRSRPSETPPVRAKIKRSEPFDINQFRVRRVRRSDNPGTNGTGTVPLDDDYDSGVDLLYYGPISLGTPAQTTTMDFDTASSDLVVPLAECTDCVGPLFNTSQSSTFKTDQFPFRIEYADGSGAIGEVSALHLLWSYMVQCIPKVAHDTVSVAGLSVDNQTFGAIFNTYGGFASTPSAGLLGLGFEANSVAGTPFFLGLVAQQKLASNVFSMYFARHGVNGSELCLGCVDSAKYDGSIQYFPLDSAATNGTLYYWNTVSSGISYAGAAPIGNFSAVFDSGTTAIIVPEEVANAFYKQIPGSAPVLSYDGQWSYPCSATLSPIAFHFGNASFTVDPLDFNLGTMDSNGDNCIGAVWGQDISSSSIAILGDAFLKSWYSVYDYDNLQVGLAKAV
ncbi:Type I transmembrane sorting receptor [Tulasnella sp. 403]|nr:Type I transmembrane sorting receptor [Tulasnella sp. 403]